MIRICFLFLSCKPLAGCFPGSCLFFVVVFGVSFVVVALFCFVLFFWEGFLCIVLAVLDPAFSLKHWKEGYWRLPPGALSLSLPAFLVNQLALWPKQVGVTKRGEQAERAESCSGGSGASPLWGIMKATGFATRRPICIKLVGKPSRILGHRIRSHIWFYIYTIQKKIDAQNDMTPIGHPAKDNRARSQESS